MLSKIQCLFIALALLACTYVVPGTALKVARTDPLTTDPAGIAVAITLPDGLVPKPNSAVLRLTSKGPSADITTEFILSQTKIEKNQYRYGVQRQDLGRARVLQGQIIAQKALGETTGHLQVTFDICSTGRGPAADARGSIAVQLEVGGPMMPLFNNVTLDKVVSQDALDRLTPCSTAK